MSDPSRPDISPRSLQWTGSPILHDAAMLGAILDAYPAPSLVVDDDGRALFINRAGRQMLGLEAQGAAEQVLLKKGGDLLSCIRASETPAGCGHSPACKTCVIRMSVNRAVAGNTVMRARAFLQVKRPAGPAEAHFLVSAAPVRQGKRAAVIVTLEDLSEILQLKSLLPICFHCRKVRTGEDYWMTVEAYFKQNADIDFSHALCAECLEKHYPAIGG